MSAACEQEVSDPMQRCGRESPRTPTPCAVLFKTSEPKLFRAIKSSTLVPPGDCRGVGNGVPERQHLLLAKENHPVRVRVSAPKNRALLSRDQRVQGKESGWPPSPGPDRDTSPWPCCWEVPLQSAPRAGRTWSAEEHLLLPGPDPGPR